MSDPSSSGGDAPGSRPGSRPQVHYGPEVNDAPVHDQPAVPPLAPPEPGAALSRSDTDLQFSPVLLRRRTTARASTFKTYDDFDDFNPRRPGWQPGSEPGFDPEKPDGGHASMPTLSAPCEITVVDFSQDDMVMHHFENESFISFLEKPQETWVRCRWININGLSWDVIQAVGQCKKLHKLAIEDIMNTRNRTKCDWYPNHAFIVLTLQKLVHSIDPDDLSEKASMLSGHTAKSVLGRLRNVFGSSTTDTTVPKGKDPENNKNHSSNSESSNGHLTSSLPPGYSELPTGPPIRTLQRYHASPNEARTKFMEDHSSLAERDLVVSAEQVSVFLTSDNTVISFFEGSAEDVERPIVVRLGTAGTMLRESCDASLVVQAIIDAIIDLAIPLTLAYTDVIGDLELDVLTSPSVRQSKSLYIIISEINKMLSFLNPIDNLVNVLRDHRTTLPQDQAVRELQNPATGVIVTPMTHTYLGDVLDHCVIITESMQQMKRSADNLIDLIFNTISAAQNESMSQLTAATIFFLPLTFLTGYFGMNFEPFVELKRDTPFFWMLAAPTVFGTALVLMHNVIYNWGTNMIQRRQVITLRKDRAKKRQKRD